LDRFLSVGLSAAGRWVGLAAAALLAVPAGASAATLYDQLDHQATTGQTTTPSYFYDDMPDSDQAADDFTVPAGQIWQLTSVQTPGPQGGSTHDYRITLYGDGGSRPGAQLFQGQATVPPTSATYTFPLGGAPQLQPGHYWLSIQLMRLEVVWSWWNRTVQSGSPAVWQSTSGDNGCFTWTPRTVCVDDTASSPDQAFSLQGSATSLPTSTPPRKKCKKHKRKHKRSAESAKKKCKKKKKKRR
jgi:hypothetical protein